MGHWWDGTDMGQPKYMEKDWKQCQYVQLISHVHWPEVDHRFPL